MVRVLEEPTRGMIIFHDFFLDGTYQISTDKVNILEQIQNKNTSPTDQVITDNKGTKYSRKTVDITHIRKGEYYELEYHADIRTVENNTTIHREIISLKKLHSNIGVMLELSLNQGGLGVCQHITLAMQHTQRNRGALTGKMTTARWIERYLGIQIEAKNAQDIANQYLRSQIEGNTVPSNIQLDNIQTFSTD